MNNYNIGSIWRKWDLHVHSPLTILNNNYPKFSDGEPNWEDYLLKLETLDFSVLGVTDYFTIDGYKKVKEFKQSGRLKNVDTILPNIEFRLDKFVASKNDGKNPRRINFHVIFSNDVEPKDIEDHFLHDIDFYYEASTQNRDEKHKLKVSELERLGEKLIKEHNEFKDIGSPLQIGAMNAVVRDDQIKEILENDSRFKDKYIFVLPTYLTDLIDWNGQDHQARKILLQKSHMVFSSNSKSVSWALGENPYKEGVEKFKEEFKSLKPCIHGSDAHSIEDLGNHCIKRGDSGHKCSESSEDCEHKFCWIKADPTFEGLRQVLYEPKIRVCLQKDNPTPDKSITTLGKISIENTKINEHLEVAKTELELNQDLVVITGSKGSGKTALVDLIANCFVDRVNTSNKNSFVRRVADETDELTTTISFKDNTQFAKNLNDDSFSVENEVIYIAQAELEDHIDENSDLVIYINDLIFDIPKVKESEHNYQISVLNSSLERINRDIEVKNTQIFKLEKETDEKVVETLKAQNAIVAKRLADIEQRIKSAEKNLTKEQIDKGKSDQEKLSKFIEEKTKLIELHGYLEEIKDFESTQLGNINQLVQQTNELLGLFQISTTIPTIKFEKTLDHKKIDSEIKTKITTTIKNIEAIQKELNKLKTEIREHTTLLQQQATELKNKEQLELQDKNMVVKRNLLAKTIEERDNLFKSMLQVKAELMANYSKAIELFSSEKSLILKDLNFVPEMRLENELLANVAEELFDNRKVEVNTAIEPIIKGYKDYIIGNIPKEGVLSSIKEFEDAFKLKIKSSQIINPVSLYNLLYGDFIKVIPVVKFRGVGINRLSLGQKATVLIKIHLAQNDNPIIIDSHDDYLDNEFIMDELVDALRSAKKYRQVILVSNNGNIVVNSDADQAIIASKSVDDVISYTSGSLENPIIRNRLLEVLEGGYDAFKQRKDKYRITKF